MLWGVGCDIEEIKRFEKLIDKDEFVDLVCLAEEKKYCRSKAFPRQHFAAVFCGKEAVIKALGNLGINKISFLDIEIFHADNGCPQVKILKDIGCDIEIKVSLSHCKSTAMAQAIAIMK